MKLNSRLTFEQSVSTVKTNNVRAKGFSTSLKMLGNALVLLVLFTMNANAQVTIPGTTLSTNATSPTNTTSCVNGKYASGWNTAGKYWEWTVNATGYSAIQFSTAISSSGTGPKNGTVWYSVDNWSTGFQIGNPSYTWSTSCGSIATINLPMAADNAANLKVRLFPEVVGSSSGTNRVSTASLKGTSSSCSSVTAGSISVSGSTAFCEGLSTTLNLVGASSGSGITYLWQYDNGGGWTTATGVNNGTSYNVSGYAAGNYNFRVYVECSGCCNATTASQAITINANPATPVIDGSSVPSAPLIVDNWSTTTGLNLFDLNLTSGSGGFWSSDNTSFVVDNASTGAGHITSGGTGTLTYTITNFNGCTASASATFDAVWDNTLALYAGHDGNSTDVIVGKANATSTAMSATGFGTATPCGNGGLSGITVPTNVTSWDDVDGPVYVSYKVTPASSSYAVNVHQIHAKVRVSGTGPTKARIGYSLDGGSTWTVGDEVALTSGSCGASANDWYFTFTENGITSTTNGIIAAVFPYSSASGSGTFQVNQLEVYGDVTSSTACAGTPSAGYLRATDSSICDTGSRWLELVHPGGVGISYQWQVYNTGTMMWDNVVNPNANNTFLNTGLITAPAANDYRVVVSCSAGSSANTVTLTIDADNLPTAVISNDVPGNSMTTGTYYDFNGTAPAMGETAEWFSNYVSTANIDVNNGDFTSLFPAKNVIVTYKLTAANGCYGIDKDTFDIVPGGDVISYYLGDAGNSTSIVDVQNVTSTNLAKTGFSTGTPCSKGGLSGMTNAPAAFSTSNDHVSFEIMPNSGDFMVISGIKTTVRSSGNGPTQLQLAYRLYNGSTWGSWVVETNPYDITPDDCGYSNIENFWGDNGANPVPYSLPYVDGIDYTKMEVALFPYAPGLPSGTFQVNSITVLGKVAPFCATVSAIEKSVTGDITSSPICGGPTGGTAQVLHTVPAHTATGDATYWGTINPNDVNIAWFDYASITSGANTGTITVESALAPSGTSPQVFAIVYDNANTCLEYNVYTTEYAIGCAANKQGNSTSVEGINEVDNVTFFPNPANNTLNVLSKDAVNVSIYSIDGKLLIREMNATTLNISKLVNGMYLIEARDANNQLVKTEKLIKQ